MEYPIYFYRNSRRSIDLEGFKFGRCFNVVGCFSAELSEFNGVGAHQAETRNCKNKPSVDAAADLITLNQKAQVGWLSGHQAFRTRANMHNSSQICYPEVYKLGTRRISGPLANTTEGNIILAQLLIERIIEFVNEQTNSTIYVFLAVFFDLL